jgi:hypothetical protein
MGEPNDCTGKGANILCNTIDGDGRASGLAFLLHLSRSGAFKIQYNHLRRAFSDHMGWGGGGSGSRNKATYDCRYNVLEDCGIAGGESHPDMIQTFAGNKYGPIILDYNTVIEREADGTQGCTLQGNMNSPLSTFEGGSIRRNSFLLTIPAGRMNFGIAISTSCSTGPWVAEENWVDPSALQPITNFLRDFGGGDQVGGSASARGNVNLKTGDGVGLNAWN